MHLPQTLPSSPFHLMAQKYLTHQYVILRHCSPNLCKRNYLYGNLPFYKIQVNCFMAWDESFGAKFIPKCIVWRRSLVPFWVLRHSFLSLTDCQWLCNIQLKTGRGLFSLPPSDSYVRSFLYLLYTLIKLYYTNVRAIQPRLWPRIELSSGGQESHCLIFQQQPFNIVFKFPYCIQLDWTT